jgi:hypothetical protein
MSPDFRPGDGPGREAQRANHYHDHTFFRKGGGVILEPDDLAEGAGDLYFLDRNNNPLSPDGQVFLELQRPELPDGWFPYLGTAPSGVSGPTKQASSPLPIDRPGFLANQPVFQGDPPPSNNDPGAAALPRPEAPILVPEPAGIEGYPTSTVTSPFFVALSYAKRRGPQVIAHTELSPAVIVPPNDYGQSIRAILYEDIPDVVTHLGVWLTEPGTSTADTPGPFRLQREVSVEYYNPGTYDLTGPYRYGKKIPEANETRLSSPGGAAGLSFRRVTKAAKPGQFRAAVVWADENGESLPGAHSSIVTVNTDSYYDEFDDEGNITESTMGRGELEVPRPANPPPGATGWRVYIHNEGQWGAVYRSLTQDGNERPLPLTVSSVRTGGWSAAGDNEHTQRQTDFIVSRELPVENTSGIEDPEEDLEQPVVFGIVRPPAGTYYGRITETVRGKESIPSAIASVTVTSNEIPRVIRQDAVNRIPNSDNVEVGANGLPLDHVITAPEGGAFVAASDPVLVLSTVPGHETATYSSATRWVRVNRDGKARFGILVGADNPRQGTFQGSCEIVVEERNRQGNVTETVLHSLSAVGDRHERIVYEAHSHGFPGPKWRNDTEEARIVIRFAGAIKNLMVRIRFRRLYFGGHQPHGIDHILARFRPPDASGGGGPVDPPPPPDPEPPILPPGTEVDAQVPEEDPPVYEPLPGITPALVVWPEPDRPRSTGVPYEATHTFETALPTGWASSISGATLTRETTPTITPLVGTYSLRAYKGTP